MPKNFIKIKPNLIFYFTMLAQLSRKKRTYKSNYIDVKKQ